MRYSLRNRLMFVMAGGFLVVLSLISIGLWSYARNAANKTYDLLLQGSAISILERITLTSDGVSVDFPPSALEILGLAENDRVFYRIFDQTGRTITGENSLPLPADYQLSDGPTVFEADYSGEPVRFTINTRSLPGNARPQLVGIQIGQTRRARNELQFDIFIKGLIGLTGLAIISLIFVRVAINRAMRPLSGIESDIRERESTDLSPLHAEPPREIESLIRAINGFMARLDISKDNAQSFIADVAHQMRTSLAALEGQLQIARREEKNEALLQRVEKAHQQAGRTIRLTNQLLSHAMIIHRADNQVREQVDLRALVRTCIEETLRSGESENVDFEVNIDAPPRTELLVSGDPLTLREAVLNLVQNSIQHAGKHCRISISLTKTGIGGKKYIRLIIDDDGPGIPASKRERVFDRFYKSGTHAGSGLGLAITKSVVTSHTGQIEITEAPIGGLRVIVDLPVDKDQETE